VSVTRSVVPKLSVREIEVPVHAIAQFEPLIGSDRYGELRRAAALASNVDGCMLAHSRSISTPMVRQPGMEWIRPTPAKGSRTRSHPTREASIAWRIGGENLAGWATRAAVSVMDWQRGSARTGTDQAIRILHYRSTPLPS